ncbi:sensor domain-containing diguanylate cyclase [Vibrio genomosp. F10 str. 9ZC157]|uniref:diguanylate cyclase n=1 Tax=Vibrio genomosp. F10 str. ZF-129 TaxID=1187848 RepID=A0A1E5B9T2_9VIBR|nr:diguanylate cyclase [Vibrio genomosp. F10]OEE30675.1 diguanylate cyclase [Vibrio genomosp. F10 str. ZF-129]OEE96786.1 diguanylate cyclase [Vibrio genomosp. F10 str. 9ZC157]
MLLTIGMIYLAYQQLKSSEHKAYLQSEANIHIASLLAASHIEAAASKLYLLKEAKSHASFETLAKNILRGNLFYSDILLVDPYIGSYQAIERTNTNADTLDLLSWRSPPTLSSEFSVSPIYQTSNNRWVFAVRYQPNEREAIWLELDLLHGSTLLKGMRTLNEGYLFVVDKLTGKIVFHPNPRRIGSESISYQSGIKDLVNQGRRYGQLEYYYNNQFKVSVFNADNDNNFVFVAGTNRADILANSHQFTLSALVLASLLLLTIVINYLIYQINSSLSLLNTKNNLADFKHQLRSILDRFCHHQGVQFCLYAQETGQLTTIDFHGNETLIHTDKRFSTAYTPGDIYYFGKKSADMLATKLRINTRHYAIPLFNTQGLIAIIYMPMRIPTNRSLLKIIRNYTEITLNNLLLNQKMQSKDVMTNLDNKLTIRSLIDEQLGQQHVYLALIDIDHFRVLNDRFGYQSGDNIIMQTAKLMQICFPKPKALSLARFGGEEFGLLFQANDENHAYDLCEILRHRIEQTSLDDGNSTIKYTISIGVTSVSDSQHASIGRADKALYQAKGLGRNQVVLNTFQS